MKLKVFLFITSLFLYSYGCYIYQSFDADLYNKKNAEYKEKEKNRMDFVYAKQSLADTYDCLSKNLKSNGHDYQDCEEYLTLQQRLYRARKLQGVGRFADSDIYLDADTGIEYKALSIFLLLILFFNLILNRKDKSQVKEQEVYTKSEDMKFPNKLDDKSLKEIIEMEHYLEKLSRGKTINFKNK